MVCAGLAREGGFAVTALTVDYGQRHRIELNAARTVAAQLGDRHIVLPLDLRAFGGSALTSHIEVPKDGASEGVPVTYVPARNTIFLSFALAFAETLEASDIFIGVNALDYSGYPDCRPGYLAAFETMANLATRAGVEGRTRTVIHAPLMELTKEGIIRLGTELGVDYSLTHSCYDPVPSGTGVEPCGACDSCLLRAKGFAEAGLPDPTHYAG